MDASDGLADMAFKNITDMMRGKPKENVDIVLQIHAYDLIGLRYRVTQDGLTFLEEIKLTGDGKRDFIDAASWAFANNTADHTMLVFSNHGWGALDPYWNAQTSTWLAAEMNLANDSNESCSIIKKCPQDIHKGHKGFMFNAQSRTYLTNQELADGLDILKEKFLNGKPIDIIAFDTCMGSMLEVATCIASYARYLVGVQSCALRDGFDYQGFLSVLNEGLLPRETAIQFINVFDNYYKKHDAAGIYTCALLDMVAVDSVNSALNDLVGELLQNQEYIVQAMQARDASPRFCLWPIYTDLIAFCTLLETRLMALPDSNAREKVLATLHNLYREAETMVVARCGGTTTQDKAHGFSIYLPYHTLEDSYLSSLFAHHSQWPNLLMQMCS